MTEEEVNIEHLKKLTEELCTSGQLTLDAPRLKALKNICKQDDKYVVELYKYLRKWLKTHHSEIRLSSFQICNEIFSRSHCFRQLILRDFTYVANLVIGLNPKKPLPKPKPAAEKLRELSIRSIGEWYDKFGDEYQKLTLGYKYLKDSKSVDFEYYTIWSSQDRQRREEGRRKETDIMDRRVKKVNDDLELTVDEIYDTIDQYKNCFKLLIPDLHNFFIPIDEDDDDNIATNATEDDGNAFSEGDSDEYGSHFMRSHGLIKETSVAVDLFNIHKVQETLDNELIISTLKEQVSLLQKFSSKAKGWEQHIRQYSAVYPALIKKIVDIKVVIDRQLNMYKSLTIVPMPNNSKDGTKYFPDSDSDSDDDFIDVPVYDPKINDPTTSEAILLGISENRAECSSGINNLDNIEAGPSGVNHGRKEKDTHGQIFAQNKKQNVESFLEDKWEAPVKCQNNMAGLSQVWLTNEGLHSEDNKLPNILGFSTRVINYERDFEPVHWDCRAPLPTGRLCPRKDREVCPLHGPVVPRDEVGKPLRPEDLARDKKRREILERKYPAWQDPTLLADIKASSGVDLDMRNVRKRKRKYPNLTNLKQLENTPRHRLAKKVLSKKALCRMNKQMARIPN